MSDQVKPAAAADTKTFEDAKAEVNQAADNITEEIIEVDFEGYQFKVDTGLMDDVDALEMIDSIENKNNMMTIVEFLTYLIGEEGYKKMKAHFIKKDGRFRISKLSKIYVAIFDKFDPKG